MWKWVTILLEYTTSIARLSLVFLVILYVPRAFVHYLYSRTAYEQLHTPTAFRLGLENFTPRSLDSFIPGIVKKQRIGLITNHTGRDQQGRRNSDLLSAQGFQVDVIFTPQHGFNPCTRQQEGVGHEVVSHIPLINWYNQEKEVERNKYVSSLDAIVFDLQDSGMRYGYNTLLLDVMKVAGTYHKPLIILDRPNLLGSHMEGLVLKEEVQHDAFNIPLPLRHGMTTGELAHYFNAHIFHKMINVYVIPMKNYHRYAWSSRMLYGLSPNIENMHACHGYSFLGLLGEISPFDIGVGTDKAFQCILLPDRCNFPKQKWTDLQRILERYGLESKFYRTFSKRKREYCSGLALCVRDINTFSSFSALLAVVSFFKQAGVSLLFSHRFDKAIGSTKVRAFFEGAVSRKQLEQEVNNELDLFFAKAIDIFLYKPLPKVVRV